MEKKIPNALGKISIIFATLNAIGLLLIVGLSLYFLPRFSQVFCESGATLPCITQLFINTHWTLWVSGTLVLLSVLAGKELIKNKTIPLILNGLFVLLGIVYIPIFTFALYAPIFAAP
jgi:type II secretory pathway component PulF